MRDHFLVFMIWMLGGNLRFTNYPVQKTFPFMIVPKASKSEKNEGLDDNFVEKLQANAKYRPSHLEEANSGSNGKPHGRYSKTKNNHPSR